MKSQIFLTKLKLQNNTSLIKSFFLFLPIVKFVVREESMQPLLYPGDTILIYRFSEIKKNDIVVLKNPQENSKENYLIKQVIHIKKKEIFVAGMNKKNSIDSRHFGWISKKDIIGKMIVKLS